MNNIAKRNGFSLLKWEGFKKEFKKREVNKRKDAVLAIAFLGPPCFEFRYLAEDIDKRSDFLLFFRALITLVVASRDMPSFRKIAERVELSIPSSMTAGPESEAIFCVGSALRTCLADWAVSSAGWAFFYGAGAPLSWGGFIFENNKWESSGDDHSTEVECEILGNLIRSFAWGVLLGEETLHEFYYSERWRKIPKLSIGLVEFDDFASRFAEFSFWREWYQGFLDNQPIHMELQERITLIPEEDWSQGPTHVAEVIDKIRACFDLEEKIERLEGEREELVTFRDGIGGNYPPEPLDDAVSVKEVGIIWLALNDLKLEAKKDEPDKYVVTQIIETLSAGLKAILGWCARKGDLSVDTLIKWGIPIAGAALLANPELLEAIVQAANKWLQFL